MWKINIVLVLLSLGCVSISAQATGPVDEVSVDTLTEWVNEILDGVTSLVKKLTPGRLFAFGPRSFPVLIGAKDTDALVVAAELGNGRIVAVASHTYVHNVAEYDHGCLPDNDSRGRRYTGTLATTKNGYTCQNWTAQSPHSHAFTTADRFPDADMESVGNNCRNPDNRPFPYCFTTDTYRVFDYCVVPNCIAPSQTDDMNLYGFHTNSKTWLSHGEYSNPRNLHVCYITDVSDLSCLDDEAVSVAVWKMTEDLGTEKADARVLEWVRQGGGLLYGIVPSHWDKYTGKGRLWTEIPFYSVLKEAGIGLTYKNAKDVKGQYLVDKSEAGINKLHSLSLYYHAKKLTGKNDMADSNRGDFLKLMLSIIDDEMDVAYTAELRSDMLQAFMPFLLREEPTMPWPINDRGAGVRPMFDTSGYKRTMYKLYTHAAHLGLWHRKKMFYVDKFPGDVTNPPPRVNISMNVTSQGKRVAELWTTGHYLLAGDEMTITVTSADTDNTWRQFLVIVGMHTDNLNRKTNFYRYPKITRKVPLRHVTTTITSAFGGTVVLQSPANEDVHIEMTISGLTKAPYYKLGDTQSMANWNESRLAPAPWAELEGRLMTWYLPSTEIRSQEDPAHALAYWDEAVRMDSEFSARPWQDQRRQLFIMDLQIVVGMLHAGYPIMAHMSNYGSNTSDLWPLSLPYKKTGGWGIFHEIGHNMQRKEWTPNGYVEVTVNIFSMYCMELLAKTDPFGGSEKYESNSNARVTMEVVANKDYSLLESGDNNWSALLSYVQLYEQFGWDCYRKIFQSYEDDRESNPDMLPRNNDNTAKLDQWVVRWSQLTRYNLCPLFEYWAYPLTICRTLTIYPPFLPTDSITEKEEGLPRIKELEKKYPGLLRALPEKPECYTWTYYDKVDFANQIDASTDILASKIGVLKERFSLTRARDNPIVAGLHNVGKMNKW